MNSTNGKEELRAVTRRADRERRTRLALIDAIVTTIQAPHDTVQALVSDITKALGVGFSGMAGDTVDEDLATCARCQRQVSVMDDEFSAWEVIDEVGNDVVCEGCLTPAEEQAIYDNVEQFGEEMRAVHSAAARRGWDTRRANEKALSKH